LVEGLRLLFDLGAESDLEALGDVYLRQPRLDGLDPIAKHRAGVELGVDPEQTLLVLALYLGRPLLGGHVQEVLGLKHQPLRGGKEHVVDGINAFPVLLPEPDDDGELLAAFTEHGRLRAADVRANGARDPRDAQAQQGGLGPVHANGHLGPAFLTADLRIGNAIDVLEQFENVIRHAAGLFEILATDFDRDAAVGVAAAQRARELLITAGSAGRDCRARDADDDAAKRGGNLVAG